LQNKDEKSYRHLNAGLNIFVCWCTSDGVEA